MNRSRATHRSEFRNLVHRGGWIIESGERSCERQQLKDVSDKDEL
jgi:hypothetical protein